MPVSPLCSVFSTSAQLVVPNAKASIFIWLVPVLLGICDAADDGDARVLLHGRMRPILRGGMRRGEAGAAPAGKIFSPGGLFFEGLFAAAPGAVMHPNFPNIP